MIWWFYDMITIWKNLFFFLENILEFFKTSKILNFEGHAETPRICFFHFFICFSSYFFSVIFIFFFSYTLAFGLKSLFFYHLFSCNYGSIFFYESFAQGPRRALSYACFFFQRLLQGLRDPYGKFRKQKVEIMVRF